MDAITFGIVYMVSFVMPFDLKLLPVEETWGPTTAAGVGTMAKTWKASTPWEVELKTVWGGGAAAYTYFKVDMEGRILSEDVDYADASHGHGDYSYAAGKLIKMDWFHNGNLSYENRYTWTDGKLATAQYITLSNQDTTFTRFFWIGDRLDSAHTVGSSPWPEGEGYKYTYPTRDSVHLVMHRRPGDLHYGYKLENGRIVAQTGLSYATFKYPASVGIRPGASPRAPLQAGPGRFWIGSHDWLGRARNVGAVQAPALNPD